ncbi:MAG: hypothetical protein B6D61_07855, partial [Bacteroidetes bacterium 4484_249]
FTSTAFNQKVAACKSRKKSNTTIKLIVLPQPRKKGHHENLMSNTYKEKIVMLNSNQFLLLFNNHFFSM